MSEKLLIERLKSLSAGVSGPVKEALLDAAMALSEAEALAARLAEAERDTTWQDHADYWQKRCLKAEAWITKANHLDWCKHGNIVSPRCDCGRDAFLTPAGADCQICSVGNPGVYIKNGRMVCPHRPADQPPAVRKHTPECSYWDGLMAQVCNCGYQPPGVA